MIQTPTTSHRMQCMEIWGGNQSVDSEVTMAGLDAWVHSRPYGLNAAKLDEATGGGDVHYVSSCASGRITRLLVADVSGHGESVSAIAIQLRRLMRRYVNYINPAKFMEAMNEQFTSLTETGCFATAVVATYYAPMRTLSLGNAGHPAPLIYRASTGKWSMLVRPDAKNESLIAPSRSELPLGVVNHVAYEPFKVSLSRGDMVLCYTDSMIEARTEAGKLIGTQGLLELVQRISTTEPGAIIAQLLQRLSSMSSGNLDRDDVTLLLFTPNRQTIRWRDNLMSPIRVVGDWLSRLKSRPEVQTH